MRAVDHQSLLLLTEFSRQDEGCAPAIGKLPVIRAAFTDTIHEWGIEFPLDSGLINP
jgi:hypothetical protein